MESYIIVLTLVIFSVVTLHYYKVKHLKKLQIKGVSNISHLKALINLIQIHRGLSSALISGDQSKQIQLLSIQKKIHFESKHLQDQTSITGCDKWESFTDHWGRLIKPTSRRDTDNNFKQHTQLVTNLLYLLEDEAERSHLNASSLPTFKNVGFVWRELAVTAETIGQSRAIGMGVATSKSCSCVHKIRLSFLLQKIQQTMDETLPQLSVLESFQYKHDKLLNVAISKMEFLIATIEQELLKSSNITIDQDKYFALATESIEAVNDIFNHQIEQIEQSI